MKLSDIFGGKATSEKDLREFLDSLPEPPEAVKRLMENITKQFAGKPCPACGKVHESPVSAFAILLGGQGQGPEIPQYEVSNGLSGEFEYKPRELSAMQFLPSNVVDVMEFLYERDIPFGYLSTPSGDDRILLISSGEEVDTDTDELLYGKWMVVTGSRKTEDLGYVAYDDEQFRRIFQPKTFAATSEPEENGSEDELARLGDSLLDSAEKDALDAYGDNG